MSRSHPHFLSVSPFIVNLCCNNEKALAASENPLAQVQPVVDPTLFCTAHKRARFYLFTKNEPEK